LNLGGDRTDDRPLLLELVFEPELARENLG
jgi:hypothetical protein